MVLRKLKTDPVSQQNVDQSPNIKIETPNLLEYEIGNRQNLKT